MKTKVDGNLRCIHNLVSIHVTDESTLATFASLSRSRRNSFFLIHHHSSSAACICSILFHLRPAVNFIDSVHPWIHVYQPGRPSSVQFPEGKLFCNDPTRRKQHDFSALPLAGWLAGLIDNGDPPPWTRSASKWLRGGG